MRHKTRRDRLNKKPDHARLMQRNLVTSLLLYEQIRTTRKRARVIQPLVDKLITTSKGANVSIAIRAINAQVADKNASRKLVEVLSKRYAGRSSGFTRIKPVGARKGDGAELVDMMLVDAELAAKAEPAKTAVKKKPESKKEPAKSASAKKTADSPASDSSASSDSK